MKNSLSILMITLMMFFNLSCVTEDSEELQPDFKNIEISSVASNDYISLSWKPVEGVSWYQIYIAESGQPLVQITNYQDLQNNPISYRIADLKANTNYEIKMEGTDYASGGKLVASKTLKITTMPN